jgi:predicted DNA-binding transcriptional regulator AlpA
MTRSTDDFGLMRLPDVLAAYPVSKSTWWAGVRSGRFPAPVKLGERITAWRAEDIRALCAQAGQ